jgi:hypothetical protein
MVLRIAIRSVTVIFVSMTIFKRLSDLARVFGHENTPYLGHFGKVD